MPLSRKVHQEAFPISATSEVGQPLPDGSLLIDPQGHILALSPGVERMFGRRIAALAESLEDTDDFPRQRVLEALRRARNVWGQTSQLVTLERQQRHYVLVRTEILRDDPRGERMLAMVLDLTEILRCSDVAGDLARQAQHDLRGPLTSLRGAVDLLRSGRLGGLEEAHRKLLDLMDRAAQQMSDLLSTAPDGSLQEPNRRS